MHLLPILSLVIHQTMHVLILSLLQHFIFHHIRSLTVSVARSNLPFNIVVSSVNCLNSSYLASTKPLSFKTTKSLIPKSLALFKTSVYIKSSVSGTVSNGALSDSTNTLDSCVVILQFFSSSVRLRFF